MASAQKRLPNLLGCHARHLDPFAATGQAPYQGHVPLGHAQFVGDELDQGPIGLPINGRRLEPDQDRSLAFPGDAIGSAAGLDPDRHGRVCRRF